MLIGCLSAPSYKLHLQKFQQINNLEGGENQNCQHFLLKTLLYHHYQINYKIIF